MQRSDDSYEILTGTRRCYFATLKKSESILCLVLPAHTAPRSLLDLILTEQDLYRPLSLAEKARFIEICNQHLDPDEIVSSYLERLQLRKRISTLDELTALLQQNTEILEAIDQGQVQEKMAAELLLLSCSTDRLALVRLFCQLQLGDNQQKKLFSALRDLSQRNQIPLAKYIARPDIQEILGHQCLNLPQKVQHLGRLLQQQLNPQLTKTQQDFHNRVKELHLPSRYSLQSRQAFETDTVDLTITFKNLSACTTILPTIRSLLGDEQ